MLASIEFQSKQDPQFVPHIFASEYIIPLRFDSTSDPLLLGNKASELVTLLGITGLRIPPGVVVTTAACDLFLKTCNDRNDILSRELPSALSFALFEAYSFMRELAPQAPLIARSSSPFEDGRSASWAGQFLTVRDIQSFSTFVDAYRQILASMLSEEALDYGAHKVHHTMAVILQRQLDCQASGVCFSRDIRTGAQGIFIESVALSGEPLVNGTVTPDFWLFDPLGVTLLEKRIVDPGNPAMSDDSAQRVALEIAALAAQKGLIIDVEFGLEDDDLNILQRRPETTFSPDSNDPLVRGIKIDPTSVFEQLVLGGEIGSLGAACGRLIVIDQALSTNPEHDNLSFAKRYLNPGDILATLTTNIGWTPLFSKLGGVISDRGGVTSHTAIIAREKSCPAVVGARNVIDALKKHLLSDPATQSYESGTVLIGNNVTLDANNRRLITASCAIETGHLSEFLTSTSSSHLATSYYSQRREFAHFVDGQGVDWTGKPEIPLSPLQFDLYKRGWEAAYELIGISSSELPLSIGRAIPDPQLQAERKIGRISFETRIEFGSGSYPVVAFETQRLAELGDSIREKGVRFFQNKNEMSVLDQLLAYHERRKECFDNFAKLIATMEAEGDVTKVDLRGVLDSYISVIGFAHVRAAFRRRVVGPLRAEWIAKLPETIKQYVESMIVLASNGLYTVTTHERDPQWRKIVQRAITDSDLHDAICGQNVDQLLTTLALKHQSFFHSLQEFMANFKIQRSQSDNLENELPYDIVLQNLKESVRHGLPPAEPLFFRSVEGFSNALDRLKSKVHEGNPGFDFENFKRVMVLAWEISALTDNERHLQHRAHSIMKRQLLELGDRLSKAGHLDNRSSIFNLNYLDLLALQERLI